MPCGRKRKKHKIATHKRKEETQKEQTQEQEVVVSRNLQTKPPVAPAVFPFGFPGLLDMRELLMLVYFDLFIHRKWII